MRKLTANALAGLMLLGLAACSDTETKYVVTQEVPACSTVYPTGACEAAQSCFQGACVATSTLCSAANTSGACPGGWACYEGGCIPAGVVPQACSATVPNGTCDTGETCVQGTCLASATVCSASNQSGVCPTNWTCYKGGCVIADAEPPDPCAVRVNTVQPSVKVSADMAFTPAPENAATDGYITTTGMPVKVAGAAYTYDADANTSTPEVEVPYTQKNKLTVDGLTFKDSNGNGTLDYYEDWRYSAYCRAQHLATLMTVAQKVGLMSESSNLGSGDAHTILPTQTGSGFGVSHVPNVLAQENRRQGLLRFSTFSGAQYARYFNAIQAMAEGLPLGIPVAITADPVHFVTQSTAAATGNISFSITAAISQWTNPMGFGAINDEAVTFAYGDTVRREFRTMGLNWQLGPMVDIATEPRWARFITTFGDNPQAVAKHGAACISGFQGSDLRTGIAATMKHFPGAGADDDGKDSHNAYGRWNVFPGDNFEAHQIPFRAAIDAGAAAVMPCYSIFKGQYEYDPDQVAAATSKGLITGYLKETLGFDGMVTGDWGVISKGFGLEALDSAERAAWFIKAGSHQLGSDHWSTIKAAYDQGLLNDAEIDGAAAKILEMSFKLGLFEDPYSDPVAAAAEVRSEQNLRAGFESQKMAIVLLKNPSASSAARLPILPTRYVDAGGTPGQPDANEFVNDADHDGQIEVFFDGATKALNGSDQYDGIFGAYDYRAAAVGTPGTAGYSIPVVAAASAATADIAVLRITARKGSYSGLDAGVPLSFDVPYPGFSADNGQAAAVKDAKRVVDLFRIRDGYTDYQGNTVDATNSALKIVLVMHMDRPSPVTGFVNGLKSLNETLGVQGSYPSVSDPANVNATAVSTSTPTAKAGVDAFLVEFGAYDRAVLDFLFAKNPITGWTYGAARLPVEIPRDEAQVNAQFEDVPSDTVTPIYFQGAGNNLPTN